jgi:deoxyribodipyrimidine photo-lyase
MGKRYRTSVFIFRRDLRLDDNTGLRSALESSEQVIPIFIFDPQQISEHPYRSLPALQFMYESLAWLESLLSFQRARLYFFEGNPHQVIEKLVEEIRIDAVFVNRDYTPYSIARDQQIKTICDKNRVAFVQCADLLLTEPEAVHKENGEPYTIYTPFAKRARTLLVAEPQPTKDDNYFAEDILGRLHAPLIRLLSTRDEQVVARGGGFEAEALIEKLDQRRHYATDRDIPSLDATTGLSPHLKFGTVSVRRVFHEIVKRFGESHQLISELYWRDFFTHIAFHSPHIFQGAFHRKYDAIRWEYATDKFERWCNGQTGFPIVDAGMRQLNQTGTMHNRVRMIVASFLTKDLHIDWRWGERYFAQHLADYDSSVNNGNWQWAASTGCDAAPYFRIFNPWLQQKRYDPDCVYIRRWIPELSDISAATIHALFSSKSILPGYPPPMVNHQIEAEISKRLYAALNVQPKGSV